MKTERETIAIQLLNLMTEFNERDARSRCFGTDTPLYHSEIHLLAFVSAHPDLHPAEIARALGLTRGAVSQTLNRLERKGFVRKEKDPENCRRIRLSPTEKGRTACRNHAEQHERCEALISDALREAGEDRLAFLRELIGRLESILL